MRRFHLKRILLVALTLSGGVFSLGCASIREVASDAATKAALASLQPFAERMDDRLGDVIERADGQATAAREAAGQYVRGKLEEKAAKIESGLVSRLEGVEESLGKALGGLIEPLKEKALGALGSTGSGGGIPYGALGLLGGAGYLGRGKKETVVVSAPAPTQT